MTTQLVNISVTTPINLAIERVKRMLFKPFDLGKWFVIGFCAWLAGLGERGGFNGNFGGGQHHSSGPDFRHELERGRDYVVANLNWILPLTIALVLVIIAIGLVFLWLNSRGKFMFLHCVALDRAEVVEPWHRFSHQGNSLFLFRVVLSLIGTVLTLPLVIFAVISIFKMILHEQIIIEAIIKAAALILTVILIAIVFAIIKKLTMDFVVPIMFLRGKRCLDSWREFWILLSGYLGEFVLYFLFQIVLGIAISAIVLIIVLITCCCAGCLMALPYLGTVLLLPVLIFKRAYSLYFLAQFGRDYDAFSLAPPASGAIPSLAPGGI